MDRGRESRLSSAPPPSEPDGRISRIRLSSRWSYPGGDRLAETWAATGGSAQVRQGIDSDVGGDRTFFLHAQFGCGRHAIRRRHGFSPKPLVSNFSVVFSRPRQSQFRHCRRGFLWRFRFASTFLRPFAPPELPGFVATMNALTPDEAGSSPVPSSSGLSASRMKSSGRSVSNHP
jgi:hypothetical protein